MDAFVLQTLNGLVFGITLFLLASGLSLIFGLMDFINLAHGGFYMLGAYLGLSLSLATGNYWLALALVPPAVALLGFGVERVFLRPLYKRGHLDQVLLTFGLAIFMSDAIRWIWGARVKSSPIPPQLSGSVDLVFGFFPKYRLFLIGAGLLVAVVLWWMIERTSLGAKVRAGVNDAQMAGVLGVDVSRLFSFIFALGLGLAALSGVLAGPVFSLFPGMDFAILISVLVVVVVGGMGSLKGAFLGSILIGLSDSFGQAYLPQLNRASIFLVMILVLLIKPSGLGGKSLRA